MNKNCFLMILLCFISALQASQIYDLSVSLGQLQDKLSSLQVALNKISGKESVTVSDQSATHDEDDDDTPPRPPTPPGPMKSSVTKDSQYQALIKEFKNISSKTLPELQAMKAEIEMFERAIESKRYSSDRIPVDLTRLKVAVEKQLIQVQYADIKNRSSNLEILSESELKKLRHEVEQLIKTIEENSDKNVDLSMIPNLKTVAEKITTEIHDKNKKSIIDDERYKKIEQFLSTNQNATAQSLQNDYKKVETDSKFVGQTKRKKLKELSDGWQSVLNDISHLEDGIHAGHFKKTIVLSDNIEKLKSVLIEVLTSISKQENKGKLLITFNQNKDIYNLIDRSDKQKWAPLSPQQLSDRTVDRLKEIASKLDEMRKKVENGQYQTVIFPEYLKALHKNIEAAIKMREDSATSSDSQKNDSKPGDTPTTTGSGSSSSQSQHTASNGDDDEDEPEEDDEDKEEELEQKIKDTASSYKIKNTRPARYDFSEMPLEDKKDFIQDIKDFKQSYGTSEALKYIFLAAGV